MKHSLFKLSGSLLATATLGIGVASAQSGSINTSGPGSYNRASVMQQSNTNISTSNSVDISNDNHQTATSGNATVGHNTYGGSAYSGDAYNQASSQTDVNITTNNSGGYGNGYNNGVQYGNNMPYGSGSSSYHPATVNTPSHTPTTNWQNYPQPSYSNAYQPSYGGMKSEHRGSDMSKQYNTVYTMPYKHQKYGGYGSGNYDHKYPTYQPVYAYTPSHVMNNYRPPVHHNTNQNYYTTNKDYDHYYPWQYYRTAYASPYIYYSGYIHQPQYGNHHYNKMHHQNYWANNNYHQVRSCNTQRVYCNYPQKRITCPQGSSHNSWI